jgi:hypothetical protein
MHAVGGYRLNFKPKSVSDELEYHAMLVLAVNRLPPAATVTPAPAAMGSLWLRRANWAWLAVMSEVA